MSDVSPSQNARPPQPRSLPWLAGRGRLTQAIELEERMPSGLIAAAVAVLVLAMLLFVAWAAFARVGEVASASGDVLPLGTVRRIQHLEGGIIAALRVREGDLVEAGQSLVELDPGTALPELEQLKARFAALSLQRRQLGAFRDGIRAASLTRGGRFDAIELAQDNVLRAKLSAIESQDGVLREQVNQRRTDKATYEAQRGTLREQLDLAAEQVSTRAGLVEKGLAARMTLLDLQRDHARMRTQIAEVDGQILRAESGIAEAEARLVELYARSRRESAEEFAKMEGDIAELSESILRAEDRVRRLVIRAPVRGVVKGLQTETLGGVITPGSVIMEVIPVDVPLMVEARLPTREIGFVQVGQPASIKVTTYDYTRFGMIEGRVEMISATTFLDEKGAPYYRVRIRLDANHLGRDPAHTPLSSGMSVIADIKTGEKTVLAYLLKPLVRATSEAFRER